MIQFVGAGPGAEDLITVRGAKLLEQADVVVYAGSLVNPAHLARTKQGCQIYDSASMTLEQVMDVMIPAAQAGKLVVRLHTGDPSIYGAIREQMDVLDEQGIAYDVCPGVSSFCGAAAALHAEYTLPDVSQTVILSRMAGRTPVPERESIRKLAEELIAGGYAPETPAAIVYKATWPDQRVFRTTIAGLEQTAKDNGISKTALITVGGFLGDTYERSKLYDPSFAHGCREASK